MVVGPLVIGMEGNQGCREVVDRNFKKKKDFMWLIAVQKSKA